MAIAGQVSRRMLEYYSHIRLAAKRAALDSIAQGQNPVAGVHSPAHNQRGTREKQNEMAAN